MKTKITFVSVQACMISDVSYQLSRMSAPGLQVALCKKLMTNFSSVVGVDTGCKCVKSA